MQLSIERASIQAPPTNQINGPELSAHSGPPYCCLRSEFLSFYRAELTSLPCGALLLTLVRYITTKMASTTNESTPGGSSHPTLCIGGRIVRLAMYMKNAPPAITTPRREPYLLIK